MKKLLLAGGAALAAVTSFATVVETDIATTPLGTGAMTTNAAGDVILQASTWGVTNKFTLSADTTLTGRMLQLDSWRDTAQLLFDFSDGDHTLTWSTSFWRKLVYITGAANGNVAFNGGTWNLNGNNLAFGNYNDGIDTGRRINVTDTTFSNINKFSILERMSNSVVNVSGATITATSAIGLPMEAAQHAKSHDNQVTFSNGTKLTTSGGFNLDSDDDKKITAEEAATPFNNTFTFTGEGTALSVGASLQIGRRLYGQSLVLDDHATASTVTFQMGPVANQGGHGTLVVDHEASFTVTGDAAVGSLAGAGGNTIYVQNGATFNVAESGKVLNLGYGSSDNKMVVSNATLNVQTLNLGSLTQTDRNNEFVLSGSSASLSILKDKTPVFLGHGTFTVENGAVYDGTGAHLVVCDRASRSCDTVKVRSGGKLYLGTSKSNTIYVGNGAGASDNTVDIQDGIVDCNAIQIGANATASNNTFRIAGADSVLTVAGGVPTMRGIYGNFILDDGFSYTVPSDFNTSRPWDSASGGEGNGVQVLNGAVWNGANRNFYMGRTAQNNNRLVVSNATFKAKTLAIGMAGYSTVSSGHSVRFINSTVEIGAVPVFTASDSELVFDGVTLNKSWVLRPFVGEGDTYGSGTAYLYKNNTIAFQNKSDVSLSYLQLGVNKGITIGEKLIVDDSTLTLSGQLSSHGTNTVATFNNAAVTSKGEISIGSYSDDFGGEFAISGQTHLKADGNITFGHGALTINLPEEGYEYPLFDSAGNWANLDSSLSLTFNGLDALIDAAKEAGTTKHIPIICSTNQVSFLGSTKDSGAAVIAFNKTLPVEAEIVFVNDNKQVDLVIHGTEDAVAQIGERKYDSLARAFAVVQAGETVQLLTDIETSDTVTLKGLTDVTLDLAGHGYNYAGEEGSYGICITNATVSLANSEEEGGFSGSVFVDADGQLSIVSGTYEADATFAAAEVGKLVIPGTSTARFATDEYSSYCEKGYELTLGEDEYYHVTERAMPEVTPGVPMPVDHEPTDDELAFYQVALDEAQQMLSDEQQATFKAMFKAVKSQEGDQWYVTMKLTAEAEAQVKAEALSEIKGVLATPGEETTVTINGVPGFYYTVGYGAGLGEMSLVGDGEPQVHFADGEYPETFEIPAIEGTDGFYQIHVDVTDPSM